MDLNHLKTQLKHLLTLHNIAMITFSMSPYSHILENLNIPYPYKDWDEGEDTRENRWRRYKNVNSEMALCFLINVVIREAIQNSNTYGNFLIYLPTPIN